MTQTLGAASLFFKVGFGDNLRLAESKIFIFLHFHLERFFMSMKAASRD